MVVPVLRGDSVARVMKAVDNRESAYKATLDMLEEEVTDEHYHDLLSLLWDEPDYNTAQLKNVSADCVASELCVCVPCVCVVGVGGTHLI
jgi:hypothetical protein